MHHNISFKIASSVRTFSCKYKSIGVIWYFKTCLVLDSTFKGSSIIVNIKESTKDTLLGAGRRDDGKKC